MIMNYSNLFFDIIMGVLIGLLAFAFYWLIAIAPGNHAEYYDLRDWDIVCVKQWDKNHKNIREQCQLWNWVVATQSAELN